MTDLMARKSRRLVDQLRMKLRTKAAIEKDLKFIARQISKQAMLAAELAELEQELAELRKELEPTGCPTT